LILSFWNDSIFYLFLGPFRHLVGWVEPEGEWERGRVGDGESGRRGRGRVGDGRVGEGETGRVKISI